MTVNHDVVGSSPTAGVLETQQILLCFFVVFERNGSLLIWKTGYASFRGVEKLSNRSIIIASVRNGYLGARKLFHFLYP